MKFELPPLPYAYDALVPYMSEATLRTHHGKHHKAYVEKLNGLNWEGSVSGTSVIGKPIP